MSVILKCISLLGTKSSSRRSVAIGPYATNEVTAQVG
jgi:hypothetical protein